MNLISNEEKIALPKNLLADPDDWVSQEILSLVYQFEEDQQRSEASSPKAIIRNQLALLDK